MYVPRYFIKDLMTYQKQTVWVSVYFHFTLKESKNLALMMGMLPLLERTLWGTYLSPQLFHCYHNTQTLDSQTQP